MGERRTSSRNVFFFFFSVPFLRPRFVRDLAGLALGSGGLGRRAFAPGKSDAVRAPRRVGSRDAGVLGAGLADEARVLGDRRSAFLAWVVRRASRRGAVGGGGQSRGARGSDIGYET